nr:ATP-binding protein [Rhizobium cellulosilyticum]
MAFGGTAILVAGTVFAVDTLTDIEGAIAVLYVVALMLAAQVVGRRGLVSLTILLVFLALLSLFLTHGLTTDYQTILRVAVAIAALFVTSALLLRADRARLELVQTNSALRESESRYRSIFDNTNVALWERDYSKVRAHLMELKAKGLDDVKRHAQAHPDFIRECFAMIDIVDANQAAFELIGKSAYSAPGGFFDRFLPKNSDTFAKILQTIVDGDSLVEADADIVRDDGERRTVIFNISFPNEASAYNRVILSMVDVTQREEARKALADAQADLAFASKAATIGVLYASLAHELNQPLGAIGVNAQTLTRWLDRTPPDVEAAKRSADRIVRDSRRASDIIKNNRVDHTSAPRETESIEVGALVSETLSLMEHDLQREHTDVKVVQRAELPEITGVRVELQQVLINLISNAAQANTAASVDQRLVTILLDAADDGDEVSISVRDSGSGLCLEAEQKIFTPFFTTKSNGMGLGLSISRSAVEAVGGTLEGLNHPEGGALFEIRLPKGTASA